MMGPTKALLVLLLVTAAAILVTFLVAYSRKRRLPATNRKTVQDDTQLTIIGEIQTPQVEDTQTIATDEGKAIVTNETGHIVDNKVKAGKKNKKIEVKKIVDKIINRGGRPRRSTQSPGKEPTQKTTRRLKPQIACLKRERQWVLAVEVPEELLENADFKVKVIQNGLQLQRDELEESFWLLESVNGWVEAIWDESTPVSKNKVNLGQKDYLLFKLSGKDLNRGRLVKSPFSGSYLVVAPDAWERDETSAGPPPVVPEPVSLAGYKAHFFELDQAANVKIAFRRPDGGQLVINAKTPRFELVGKQLTDASEHMGPLFGEEPPRIRDLDAEAWKNVRTIVVGEEGPGRGRWRTEFSPKPGQMEQNLPSEVANRKSGWYFLRFYDTNDDLIESLDFRFIADLRGIELPVLQPFPPVDGHKPVSVAFLHAEGLVVKPVDDSTKNIETELKDDRTTLTVPADPACDLSCWQVSPKNKNCSPVEVTILVERIWWALAEENAMPSQWTDKPVVLSGEDFRATSRKALWLRLPRRRWVDKVLVGFERSKARPYLIKVTERIITIPLREFSDSTEVEDQTREPSFKVWIERHDECIEGIVASISIRAEKRPGIEEEQHKKELPEHPSPPFLELGTIPAPRLATVLTRIRRNTSGPLRRLLKEVRSRYFRGRTTRKATHGEFKKEALCMIALTLELAPQTPGVKKHYAIKACLARKNFPEIMDRLRKRYEELRSLDVRQTGNMRNRR